MITAVHVVITLSLLQVTMLTGQAVVLGYLVESLSSDNQDVRISYIYAAGKQV